MCLYYNYNSYLMFFILYFINILLLFYHLVYYNLFIILTANIGTRKFGFYSSS